ncbi:putative DnaJ domain containing protein [Trypanosoma cruzi]|nr:putative DnaJ domain containing protein [Trypanosoma cruzi]
MTAPSELSGEALVFYVMCTNGNPVRLFGADGVKAESALKRVYKTLALRLHPDKNGHPRAHEAFQVLQQSFEATLESLQSKAPEEKKTRTNFPPPCPSSFPPPPPPPPSSFAFAKSTLPGVRKEEQKQRQHAFAGNSLFEIPLPPDVFGAFAAPDSSELPDVSVPTGCPGTKPPAKRTRPLPALDLSSDDEEHVDEAGGRQASRRDDEQEHASQKRNAERKAVQKEKRSTSRRTLMQLFAEFNISDDEEEMAPVNHPTGKETGHHWEPTSCHETNRRQQSGAGKPVTTLTSSSVACPCCGAGEFSAHIMRGVVCQSCRAQFVPAAIGMMTAERHAAGRKKDRASRGELCACGKAKKGLCFLCD